MVSHWPPKDHETNVNNSDMTTQQLPADMPTEPIFIQDAPPHVRNDDIPANGNLYINLYIFIYSISRPYLYLSHSNTIINDLLHTHTHTSSN